MSEFIRKLYIDSRYRTPDSNSTSDFEIELPQTVNVERNALGWITDLHLPVTFYNIDDHCNRLYVRTAGTFSGVQAEAGIDIVELTPGNYTGETLATELR